MLAIEAYLQKNVDSNVIIKPWQGQSKLSMLMQSYYNYYFTNILRVPCVLVDIIEDIPSINVIEKHMQNIKSAYDGQIVFCFKELSSYRRKSLIERRIPFVIYNGQMFLPFLGLDLQRSPSKIEKNNETFSINGQKVYIYFLYNKDLVINATELARSLKTTKMTASRALNELEKFSLLTSYIAGNQMRSKYYQTIKVSKYVEKGFYYLKAPFNRKVYVEKAPSASYISGLEALAKNSMLNPPINKVRAIHNKLYQKLRLEIIDNTDRIKDENFVELEIWQYDPGLFANNDVVDPLSLYASLRNHKDERVQQALDESLRGEKWYTDWKGLGNTHCQNNGQFDKGLTVKGRFNNHGQINLHRNYYINPATDKVNKIL